MGSRLLLADADTRNLHALEVALQGAGFLVETTTTGEDAWQRLTASPPDLVIADAGLAGISGFELCARVRNARATETLPFIMLVGDQTLEKKILTLEAGADEYIVKPASVQEVVARVEARLKRWRRERLVSSGSGPGDAVPVGALSDLGLVELLEVLEGSGRSGILHVRATGDAVGAVYFRNGRVVDAEVGRLSGIDALARLFAWGEGTFEIEWKNIRRKDVIERPTSELISEGMQRLREWERLTSAFGDRQRVFEVDYQLFSERLAEVPDDLNAILRLCDGVRPIGQVIEQAAIPDADALTALMRLQEEGIIYDVMEREAGARRPDRAAAPALAATSPSARAQSREGSGPPSSAEPTLAAPSQAGPRRRRTAPGLGGVVPPDPIASASEGTLSKPGQEEIPEARLGPDNPGGLPPAVEESRLRAELAAAADGILSAAPGAPGRPTVGPSLGAPTQRGFAAMMKPGLSLDGFVPEDASARARNSKLGMTSGHAPEETGPAVDVRPGPIQPSVAPIRAPGLTHQKGDAVPLPLGRERSGRGAGSVDATARVHFPDEGFTRNEALDELGLPSRWRALRFLVLAVLVGGAAAIGVQRLRSRSAAMGPLHNDAATAAVGHPESDVGLPHTEEGAKVVAVGVRTDAGAQEAAPISGENQGGIAAGSLTPDSGRIVEPLPPPVALPAPEPEYAGVGGATVAQHVADKDAPLAGADDAPPDASRFAQQLAGCRTAFTKNRLREAMQACSAAVAANPRSAEALTFLAHTELNRGHLSRAADLATRAIAADPEIADAYVIIGGVRQDSGQNAEAKASYRRYLELAPKGRYADELRSIVNGL